MNFDHLLLQLIISAIWTATIAKHWSLSSARHQLFLSVYKTRNTVAARLCWTNCSGAERFLENYS